MNIIRSFLKEKKHQASELVKEESGMELVQVAILIGIAVGLGLIFKDQIGTFVDNTFGSLLGANFS